MGQRRDLSVFESSCQLFYYRMLCLRKTLSCVLVTKAARVTDLRFFKFRTCETKLAQQIRLFAFATVRWNYFTMPSDLSLFK